MSIRAATLTLYSFEQVFLCSICFSKRIFRKSKKRREIYSITCFEGTREKPIGGLIQPPPPPPASKWVKGVPQATLQNYLAQQKKVFTPTSILILAAIYIEMIL